MAPMGHTLFRKFHAYRVLVQYDLAGEYPQHSKPGEYTAFKTLTAKHMGHTFQVGKAVCVEGTSTDRLSWYRHSGADRPVRQQLLLGTVLYFKQYKDRPACKAVAVITREPKEYFGTEEFEVNVYKLTPGDSSSKQQQDYLRRSEAAVPIEMKVEFDPKQGAKGPIKVLAKTVLPQATVKVVNRYLACISFSCNLQFTVQLPVYVLLHP